MNRTILTGRWTRTPELKYTPQGTAVTKVPIAVHDGYGEKKKTYYFEVVIWGKTAEAVCQYSKKGDRVGVDGKITTRSYEKTDGTKVTVTEVVANEVEFMQEKSEAYTPPQSQQAPPPPQYQQQSQQQSGQAYQQQQPSQSQQNNQYSERGQERGQQWTPPVDDDLPF